MNQDLLNAIDKRWDEIVEVLPEETLKKLMDLPESEIDSESIYKILVESGVDFTAILSKKEEDGKLA